jgi:hypothetical protein
MAFRYGATFVRNPLEQSTPLDRNQRARLLYLAEHLERATKAKGRRNGCLGYVGLAVLRCLLLGFHNAKTGLCCPSYAAIQARTGLCRQSVARALQRLMAVGVLGVVRRLERVAIDGIVRCQQATNLYRFIVPAGLVPVPLVVPRARAEKPAPTIPHRGSLGELVGAMVARESMAQPGTNNTPLNPLPRPTRGEPDWRGAARRLINARMGR